MAQNQTGKQFLEAKVIIDPTSRVYYASYYIKGLWDVFGKNNVEFSNGYFSGLNRANEDFAFEHYFAFVLQFDSGFRKVIIDFCDPPDINHTAYEWCDVYAKINFNPSETAEHHLQKLLVIPPGFGIRIWNTSETIRTMVVNLIKSRFSPFIGIRRFIQDYRLQLKRVPLEKYTDNRQSSKQGFVFMIATLWKDSPNANQFRKQFIDAAKASADFEGGFWSDVPEKVDESFRPYLFSDTYPLEAYIGKTKQSEFVFNTPAVHDCHGWKLGEYLAMGKAIVSTRFKNQIDPDLVHREHIHFIADIDGISDAIAEISQNPEYRKSLERNAAEYFDSYVEPRAVINKVLEFLKK